MTVIDAPDPVATRQSASSVRACLQRHTAELHKASERAWLPSGRFASLIAYTGFLRCSQRAHLQLGVAAARALADVAAVDEEKLRLQALGDDLDVGMLIDPPVSRMLPDYAWGVSYVLNGSAMGASIMLQSQMIKRGWPRAYLQTAQAYARSGRLRRFFDALDAATIDRDAAVVGAQDTFAFYLKPGPATSGDML